MTKITILFGAGAEGKGQFGLPSGEGFKRDIILAENVETFANRFLKNADSGINLSKGTIISHNSSSILYQTIMEAQDQDPNILKTLFPKTKDQKTAKQYLQYKKTKHRKKVDINRKFTLLYKKNFYDALKNKKVDIDDNKSLSFFLSHAGIYSYLDSLFNYLRKPEKYKNECARVIKVYYSALLSILTGMSKSIDENENNQVVENYSKLLNKDETIDNPQELLSTLLKKDETIDNPQELLSIVIDELQSAIIEKKLSEEEKKKLYYYKVKKLVENPNNEVSCITTNYTNICQRITQLTDEHFSYVHGKLGLFEELESKHISDIKEVDLKKTVFPYLLVQSGVKPIVSPFQIKEFYKACNMIAEAEHMLIIGYGINSDDEHITTILKERLMSGKKIKYFVYCPENESETWKEKIDEVIKQLGYENQLEFYRTDEFEDVLLHRLK